MYTKLNNVVLLVKSNFYKRVPRTASLEEVISRVIWSKKYSVIYFDSVD